MFILKAIFAVFWFVFHLFIWLFALIITVVRFPTVSEFSTQKFAEVFSQSVIIIKDSDPMLLLIALLIAFFYSDVSDAVKKKNE